MEIPLRDYPITQGGIRRIQHPRLAVDINTQTCVRYLRFMRMVRIERLELPHSVYGRWVPNVPTHPAHLILSTLDPITFNWVTVKEVNLPYDPRTAGEGLSQSMSMPEMVCRDLSGNSGSFRWSCNSMDVIGFGHLDAYVNAFSYRAFRNAAILFKQLGKLELAQRCQEAAQGIKMAYTGQFLNPETGWVAGWRSCDGQLHDYAFTYINGMAVSFGLLEPDQARQTMSKLEQLRLENGIASAFYGIPCNLLPLHPDDHILPQIMYSVQPTFETYTDGSLSGWPATYYLRALSICGMKENARKMADEMEAGYASGYFNGGVGSGREFRSWEGLPNGYEGTLIGCFSPLYSIAIEKGLMTPPSPEWWPAED